LASKSKPRRSRTPERQTSSATHRRRRPKKRLIGPAEKEFLATVQTGIEHFILKDATVEEFQKMMHAVDEKEKAYSHQLTQNVFSKIVKQAIKKRNLKKRGKQT
jgi:hypothetical protein